MSPTLRPLLAAALLFLVGCRAVATLLFIPVAVVAVVFGGLAGIFVSANGVSEDEELYAGGVRIERRVLDVVVAEDGTYVGTLELESTVTSTPGIEHAQQTSMAYDPRCQELELVSASVVDPTGRMVDVDADHVFERPTAVAGGAPGFVSSRTKTVLFPQLAVGSTTRAVWEFRETRPSALGFHYAWRPPFGFDVVESRVRIAHPPGVPLRFAVDAPFAVEESEEGGLRVVEATLHDYEAQRPERAMVSPRDVCPEFLVSSSETWESIGAAFHEAVEPHVAVSPEVDALAAEIVGDREGLDAARAIHRWVCRNVHYVVVYMSPMDGWVPHPVDDVLGNRYGDCKDKFVVLASLLRARGIDAQPVLVRLDRGSEPHALPTPLQFNHCMAYLPAYDLYSNPTDPFQDIGDLDASLAGKFVVIASSRPRVARTPDGSADQNRYALEQEIVVGADGVLSGRATMDLTGRIAGQLRAKLASLADISAEANALLHDDPLGGVGDLESSDPADLDVPLHCEGSWRSDVPIPMGPIVHFAVPGGIDIVNAELVRSHLSRAERRYPALVGATEIEWHLEIVLPPGYAYEAVPVDRAVSNEAGRFTSTYRLLGGGRLAVDRLLRVEQDRYSVDEYAALRAILVETVADQEAILGARR